MTSKYLPHKITLRSPFQGIEERAENDNTKADTSFQQAGALPDTPVPGVPTHKHTKKWLAALKQVFPLYVAIHLAAFIISCLSVLYKQPDFDPGGLPLDRLWLSWHHWDVGNYISIATHGYMTAERTVFFPLYPLLERIVTFITFNKPDLAGLAISNVADLIWMVVLYQLVLEEFGQDRAQRAVLYLSVFPSAFFFLAAYTESLFLALVITSFYYARHGRWWLSGTFGLLACLTHSTGVCLIFPFCYEYLRQHQFQIRKIRFGILGGLLIPAGIGLYALYCWKTFGDPLSFSHQEIHWERRLMPPWWAMRYSFGIIRHSASLLSFYALRNLIDLLSSLLILILIILGCVGPWRFKKDYWAYLCYAIPLYLLFNLTPNTGGGSMPLESFSRYMLEMFPAFIVLATLGKFRWIHLCYIFAASAICFFLLTQFLTGHWVL